MYFFKFNFIRIKSTLQNENNIIFQIKLYSQNYFLFNTFNPKVKPIKKIFSVVGLKFFFAKVKYFNKTKLFLKLKLNLLMKTLLH